MKIKKVISGYDIQLTLTWEEAQALLREGWKPVSIDSDPRAPRTSKESSRNRYN